MHIPRRQPTRVQADQAPRAPLASWYSQGPSDGFGDRLLMFDNAATGPLELLRLRQDFSLVPGFEEALHARLDLLSTFTHRGFAPVRLIRRLEGGNFLSVVSTHVAGSRLSELFVPTRPTPGLHPASVRTVFGELVSAIAALHRQGPNIAHGAIAPERVVLTFERHLIVTDYIFGGALQRLHLPVDRLWREFGLVVATKQGVSAIDQRSDVIQLGLLMLSLVIGRRVSPAEYPGHVSDLLQEFSEICDRRSPDSTASLRTWLERVLDPAAGFRSATEAERAIAIPQTLPTSVDVHVSIREMPRALGAAAAAETPIRPVVESTKTRVPSPDPVLDLRKPVEEGVPQSRGSILDNLDIGRAVADPAPARHVEPNVGAPAPPPAAALAPVEPIELVIRPQAPPAADATAAQVDAAAAAPEPISIDAVAPAPVSAAPTPIPVAAGPPPSKPEEPPAEPAPAVRGPSLLGLDRRSPSPAKSPAPSAAKAPAKDRKPGLVPAASEPAAAPVFGRSAQPEAPRPRTRGLRVEARVPPPPATKPILRWVTAALGILVVAQAGIIAMLLTRPTGATLRTAPNNDTLQSPADAPPGKTTSSAAAPDRSSTSTPARDSVATSTEGAPGTAPLSTVVAASPGVQASTGGIRVMAPIPLQVMDGDEVIGTTANGPVFTTPGMRDLDFVNVALSYKTRVNVRVVADRIVSLTINPPNGVMSVNAQPWAQVWIDGQPAGDTPLANLSVSLGEHEVVFRHPELGERRQQAIVQAGSVTRVTASFTP